MSCLSQWESKWVHRTGPVSRHVDLDRSSVIQSRLDAERVSDPVSDKGLRNGFRANPTGGNLSAFIEECPGGQTARTRSSVRAEEWPPGSPLVILEDRGTQNGVKT